MVECAAAGVLAVDYQRPDLDDLTAGVDLGVRTLDHVVAGVDPGFEHE